MDVKEKLINGFITEIRTNYRNERFDDLLQSCDEKMIVEAYDAAIEIIDQQSEIINDRLNIKEIIEIDFSRKYELASKLLGFTIDELMFCVVEGDSMIQSNIDDGDILIIEKSKKLQNNSIIIVEVNGKHYVKRYKCINGENWLYSENPKYLPVKISLFDNFNIIGIVHNVIKKIS